MVDRAPLRLLAASTLIPLLLAFALTIFAWPAAHLRAARLAHWPGRTGACHVGDRGAPAGCDCFGLPLPGIFRRSARARGDRAPRRVWSSCRRWIGHDTACCLGRRAHGSAATDPGRDYRSNRPSLQSATAGHRCSVGAGQGSTGGCLQLLGAAAGVQRPHRRNPDHVHKHAGPVPGPGAAYQRGPRGLRRRRYCAGLARRSQGSWLANSGVLMLILLAISAAVVGLGACSAIPVWP